MCICISMSILISLSDRIEIVHCWATKPTAATFINVGCRAPTKAPYNHRHFTAILFC